MLSQIYKRALKAGGAQMPPAKYARVFGNDTGLRRNVLRACRNPDFGDAIKTGTVADHRVFESLGRIGELAARIVLDLETRLGRKLTRAKAQQLAVAYLRIVAKRGAGYAVQHGKPTTVVAFRRAAA